MASIRRLYLDANFRGHRQYQHLAGLVAFRMTDEGVQRAAVVSAATTLAALSDREWQLSGSAVNEHDRPSFSGVVPEAVREIVLDATRNKRDLLAAAIAACEQRSDSDEILASLGRFLTGEDRAYYLESASRRAGLTVEAGNVVPFIPQRRRS